MFIISKADHGSCFNTITHTICLMHHQETVRDGTKRISASSRMETFIQHADIKVKPYFKVLSLNVEVNV